MVNLETYKMFVNGEWIESEKRETFESINPSTGKPWALIPEASASDVNKAVEAAYDAFSEGEWSKITPTQRGKYLRKFATSKKFIKNFNYSMSFLLIVCVIMFYV